MAEERERFFSEAFNRLFALAGFPSFIYLIPEVTNTQQS